MKKKKDTKYKKSQLEKLILEIFRENPNRIYNYKQISGALDIKNAAIKHSINKALAKLANNNKLCEESTGRYRYNDEQILVEGIIDMTSSGKGFLVCENTIEDIFIKKKNLKTALDGDRVKVNVFHRRKGRSPEGEVVEILKRKKTKFVGIIERSKSYAFLIPADKNMPYDIFISERKLKSAQDGDKAIVQITEWTEDMKNPKGRVVELLGKAGEHETEMHAILAEFNLPDGFPKDLDIEAEKIPDQISKQDINERRDYRQYTTFTIDPDDAKDFDDALSVTQVDDDSYEIGVHIADVTHYVDEESVLNEEAYKRATSVYLVDRVVPMLPERLSNQLCSLVPNQDKLTYSIIFKISKKAEIQDFWIGRTIIHSDKRFTYNQAQEIIDNNEGEFVKELCILNDLAKKFRGKRMNNGSIDFDRFEVKFELDENGKPIRTYFKESQDSNKLIEEFMLLANKYIAKFIGSNNKKKRTFVYRTHDLPNPEKLDGFNKFINKFGYNINISTGRNISKSINSLLSEVKDTAHKNIFDTLAIRSMAKAEYTTDNIGHYGLGFDHYTHFTSPIRRYPDMMVHRLLTEYLKNKNHEADKYSYEEMCKHCSDMEQRATNAERMSIKYKQVEFMQDKIGNEYEGTISGVSQWGFYVELDESKCEGMVPMRCLNDDYYEFDSENYCVVGLHYGNKFQLGDKLKVKVKSTNLISKQLDFELA
ncbi:MAG: ribonuclease R [Marinifilaceae bacterium]|jgi:ribonuclease R|nr:ribonuclease R [Marinifilaceae bacterium]